MRDSLSDRERERLSGLEMEQAVRSLKSLRIGMTDASRRHLALSCREARPSSWGALAARFSGLALFRLPVAAGTMALFLALGVAALMVGRQAPVEVPGRGDSPVRLVSVVPAASGGVTLEWRDGRQRTYTVQRSTDPRNFEKAETYAVRGTRWTDTAPAPGQVVFYRVQ